MWPKGRGAQPHGRFAEALAGGWKLRGRVELGSSVVDLLLKTRDVGFLLLLGASRGSSCGEVEEEKRGGVPVWFDDGVVVNSATAPPGPEVLRQRHAAPGKADEKVE